MKDLEYICKIPLIPQNCYRYESMAFDGCSYFFTVWGKCFIYEYDMCFCEKSCTQTCREYSRICYDSKDNCFWATSKTCCDKIFKLDRCFNELDAISICEHCCTTIMGISYNCCDDSLVIACPHSILKLDKCTEKAEIIKKCCDFWITSVLSLCPGIIIGIIKDGKQYIQFYNNCGKLTNQYCVAECFILQNMVFNSCKKDDDKITIEILATKKDCYSYILAISLRPQAVGFFPNCCNYKICDACCKKNHCAEEHHADIVESIALIETALSHILNAEGEKLQKVLASTDDISKILCVNKEINKTIVNVTHLEHVLHAKLDTITSLSKPCDECFFDNKF